MAQPGAYGGQPPYGAVPAGQMSQQATTSMLMSSAKVNPRLQQLMERALMKLDPDGDTVPSPESTTTIQSTDSANLYTPGGSTDWSKVRAVRLDETSDLNGEEEDAMTLGDPRGVQPRAKEALLPVSGAPPASPRP